MNKSMKFRSIALTMLGMLVMLTVPLSLTSCHDSDHNTPNQIVIDGEAIAIADIAINMSGVFNYAYDINGKLANGYWFSIGIPKELDGKTIDLTKEYVNPETGSVWMFGLADANDYDIYWVYSNNLSTNHFDAGSTAYIKCLNAETREFEIKLLVKWTDSEGTKHEANFNFRGVIEKTLNVS